MTTADIKTALTAQGYSSINRLSKKQIGLLTLRIFTTSTALLYVYTSDNDTNIFKVVPSPYIHKVATKIDPAKIVYVVYHDMEATPELSTISYYLDYDEEHPIYDEVDYDNLREYHSFIWEVIAPWVHSNEMENTTSINLKFDDYYAVRLFIDHIKAVGWKEAPYTCIAHLSDQNIKYLY